jgi:hypothetical protein
MARICGTPKHCGALIVSALDDDRRSASAGLHVLRQRFLGLLTMLAPMAAIRIATVSFGSGTDARTDPLCGDISSFKGYHNARREQSRRLRRSWRISVVPEKSTSLLRRARRQEAGSQSLESAPGGFATRE